MTGTLITADYNLSQIAEVKELKVMNLSDLVIALRPEVQPGESLNIKIVREGKEKMQGIGYLDDGTMVVCLLYTSPSPRDKTVSRMPSSA